MRTFFKFIVLPFAVFVLLANLKDVGRYLKLRNMSN